MPDQDNNVFWWAQRSPATSTRYLSRKWFQSTPLYYRPSNTVSRVNRAAQTLSNAVRATANTMWWSPATNPLLYTAKTQQRALQTGSYAPAKQSGRTPSEGAAGRRPVAQPARQAPRYAKGQPHQTDQSFRPGIYGGQLLNFQNPGMTLAQAQRSTPVRLYANAAEAGLPPGGVPGIPDWYWNPYLDPVLGDADMVLNKWQEAALSARQAQTSPSGRGTSSYSPYRSYGGYGGGYGGYGSGSPAANDMARWYSELINWRI